MPKFALLLAVGLLATIPFISAQDAVSEELSSELAIEDPLRIAEQTLTFSDNASVNAVGSGVSIWAVIRMILVLALAAAAIYGAVFFIRRTTKQTPSTDTFLKVLASSHIGSNRYVHVVYVGGKAYLVGSSDGGVNLISEVQDTDTVNAMLLDDSRRIAESPQGRIPNFLTMLKRFGAQIETKTPGADEIRKRRERLKGL